MRKPRKNGEPLVCQVVLHGIILDHDNQLADHGRDRKRQNCAANRHVLKYLCFVLHRFRHILMLSFFSMDQWILTLLIIFA